MNLNDIPNPKRTKNDFQSRSHWYPYYAGYSATFVDAMLRSFQLSKDSQILDPWMGGGTTMTSASSLGLSSVGIDINPVMAIVSKARSISAEQFLSSKAIALDTIANYRSTSINYDSSSLLNRWFDPPSVHKIQKLEKSLRSTRLVSKSDLLAGDFNEDFALAYLALFRCVRRSIQTFIGTNQTWVKTKVDKDEKLSLDDFTLIAHFSEEFIGVHKDILPTSVIQSVKPRIFVGDSRKLIFNAECFDVIFGSPPYCTRIDYMIATSPELAVMGLTDKDLEARRKEVIGSVLTSQDIDLDFSKWGSEANNFLDKLYSHPSKSSQGYYLKNHLKYFSDMHSSTLEMSRVVKSGGKMALVVQDSFYKDVHNDVPQIVSEMLGNSGVRLLVKRGFNVKNSMGSLNPKVKGYRSSSTATEFVLIFQKE